VPIPVSAAVSQGLDLATLISRSETILNAAAPATRYFFATRH
jgi:hypothetical protein